MVDLFPNAKYVFLHRDVREVMASTCRLIEMLFRMNTDVIDMNALGESMLRLWSTEMNRHLQQLDALGSRIDLLDVQYEHLKNDTFGVVRDIYQLTDRDLTPRREQAMRKWDADDSHGAFGSYSYSLEQYGLTPGDRGACTLPPSPSRAAAPFGSQSALATTRGVGWRSSPLRKWELAKKWTSILYFVDLQFVGMRHGWRWMSQIRLALSKARSG